MGVPIISTDPMTVEEFYAFTDTRPDNEKWELIEGGAGFERLAEPHASVDC